LIDITVIVNATNKWKKKTG